MKVMKFLNLIIGIILGALIWALSLRFTGLQEPWDGAFLYYFGCLFLAGLLSALPSPRNWLMGTFGVFAGQWAYMFLFLDGGNLWHIGMVVSGLFMAISALGGAIVFAIWRISKRKTKAENQ